MDKIQVWAIHPEIEKDNNILELNTKDHGEAIEIIKWRKIMITIRHLDKGTDKEVGLIQKNKSKLIKNSTITKEQRHNPPRGLQQSIPSPQERVKFLDRTLQQIWNPTTDDLKVQTTECNRIRNPMVHMDQREKNRKSLNKRMNIDRFRDFIFF